MSKLFSLSLRECFYFFCCLYLLFSVSPVFSQEINTNYGADPSKWTICASEDEVCEFSGDQIVHFGANGKFATKVIKDQTVCSNTVFGDPIYGVVKTCYVDNSAPTIENGWLKCAGEDEFCDFSGSIIVRYGASDRYAVQLLTDGTQCSNEVFGDPIYRTAKSCYIALSAANPLDIDFTGKSASRSVAPIEDFEVVARVKSAWGAEVQSVEMSLDSVNWFSAVMSDTNSYIYDFGKLSVGSYTLYVRTNEQKIQTESFSVSSTALNKNRYHFLDSNWVNKTATIYAFEDETHLNLDGTFHSLSSGESVEYTIPDINTSISSDKNLSIGGYSNAVDAPNPLAFAGTQFVIPHLRENHIYDLLSTDQNANVQITINGVAQNIELVAGEVHSFAAGNDEEIAGLIDTDSPILVNHRTQELTDSYPVLPVAKNVWGMGSAISVVGAFFDNTHITVYGSEGAKTSYSLNAGEIVRIADNSEYASGKGPALHVSSTQPISAIQHADSDGLESTGFWPRELFAQEYIIPTNSQYVAIVCAENTLITHFDSDGTVLEVKSCESSGSAPGKVIFGSSSEGTHLYAGESFSATNAVYLMYESQTSDGGDEHNLLGNNFYSLPDYIIDNEDPTVSLEGPWTLGQNSSAHLGTYHASQGADAMLTWDLSEYSLSGHFEVYAMWTYYTKRSANVVYDVGHADQISSVVVNQKDSSLASQWNLLGTYKFEPGTDAFVSVNGEGPSFASADAIRLVGVSSLEPEPIPHPEPVVNQFEWIPSAVKPRGESTLHWTIENVKNCENSNGDNIANSGSYEATYLVDVGTVTATRVCTDLAGNRFPAEGYLEATRTVEKLDAPTDLTVTNPNPGTIVIDWSDVPSAMRYKVQERVNDGEWIDAASSLSSSVLTLSKRDQGQYQYQVWPCTYIWGSLECDGYGVPITSEVFTAKSIPQPNVVQFEWIPAVVKPRGVATLHWSIENVENCEDKNANIVESAGSYRANYLVTIGTITSKRVCNDLLGNRFPATGYLNATRTVEKLDAPANVTVSNPNLGKIKIDWSDVPSAMRYKVRESVNGSEWKNVATSLSFSELTLIKPEGGQYQYQVWPCTYIRGPLECEGYGLPAVSNTITIEEIPKPRVIKFEWQPAKVKPRGGSTFSWNIENVKSCESSNGESVEASGSYEATYLVNIGTVTTKRVCKDLLGNRFPAEGYLEATRTVEVLDAPTNLTVDNPTPGKLLIDWDDVPNAMRYKVQERFNGSDWKNVNNSLEPSKLTLSRRDEGRYEYKVWPCTYINGPLECEGYGISATSGVLTAEAIPEPEVVQFEWIPATVKPRIKSTLYWDIKNVANCETSSGTNVSLSGNSGKKDSSTIGTLITQYVCTDLRGQRYPTSGFLEAHKTVEKFDAPTPVLVTSPSIDTIKVNWSVSADVNSYQLEEKIDDGVWSSLGTNYKNTYKVITDRGPGKYEYRVKGCAYILGGDKSCELGVAAESEEFFVEAHPEIPPTLSIMVSENAYLLEWTGTGATRYKLEYKLNNVWTNISTNLTENSYQAPLSDGDKFRVSACNWYGCSEWREVNNFVRDDLTISRFSKSADEVPAGQSVLLSWQVDSVANIEIISDRGHRFSTHLESGDHPFIVNELTEFTLTANRFDQTLSQTLIVTTEPSKPDFRVSPSEDRYVQPLLEHVLSENAKMLPIERALLSEELSDGKKLNIVPQNDNKISRVSDAGTVQWTKNVGGIIANKPIFKPSVGGDSGHLFFNLSQVDGTGQLCRLHINGSDLQCLGTSPDAISQLTSVVAAPVIIDERVFSVSTNGHLYEISSDFTQSTYRSHGNIALALGDAVLTTPVIDQRNNTIIIRTKLENITVVTVPPAQSTANKLVQQAKALLGIASESDKAASEDVTIKWTKALSQGKEK